MKKRIWAAVLSVCLLASAHMTARAETSYGGSDWSVTFTNDKRMDSNFKSSDMNDVIYGMQPGDTAVITLNLNNSNTDATDWYLKNEVLYSLEDRSANSGTKGGAYTYKLSYEGPGETRTLFDSDAVGGESGEGDLEGLHQATNGIEDKSNPWLFLDTLSNGQAGKVTLEVSLDGDTQGNDYQDTLADLRMSFAVEMSTADTNNRGTTPNAPNNPRTVVQTGDENELTPYILLACISGGLLLVFAAYTQISRSRERKGGMAHEAH